MTSERYTEYVVTDSEAIDVHRGLSKLATLTPSFDVPVGLEIKVGLGLCRLCRNECT